MGGMEPLPSQLEDPFASFGVTRTLCGGGRGGVGAVIVGSGEGEVKLSLDFLLDSSRLFLSVSNSSTLSLHCNSNCRRDSMSAFSVDDAGRYVVGLRRALW
jgi:hypothetical protein